MSEPLVRLVTVPEKAGAAAKIARVVARDQRPVLIFDLRPQLRGKTRRADRTGVPGIARVHAGAIGCHAVQLSQLRGALLKHAFSVSGRKALNSLDEGRERGLGI